MNKTSIEWTDYTWNPIRARLKGQGQKVHSGTFCTRISPGCTNCYASVINKRFGNGLEYTVPNLERVEFFIDEKILEEPLRRKKPARIFVGDMFDLFHEAIPEEFIGHVWGVMAQCPQHTFQVLTKRASEMQDLISNAPLRWGPFDDQYGTKHYRACCAGWPLPNVWLGVSVEDQKRAEERIPLLQMTPAAVRFISIEPQLEDIPIGFDTPELGWLSWLHPFEGADPPIPRIDWVICGGESGPGARPFNLAWAESLLAQCRAAGVPFFMKQVGSQPFHTLESLVFPHGNSLRDRKGGDPSEWPEHLRVREFPSQKRKLTKGGNYAESTAYLGFPV